MHDDARASGPPPGGFGTPSDHLPVVPMGLVDAPRKGRDAAPQSLGWGTPKTAWMLSLAGVFLCAPVGVIGFFMALSQLRAGNRSVASIGAVIVGAVAILISLAFLLLAATQILFPH